MTDIPDIFKKATVPTTAAAELQRRADSVIDGLRPQYIIQTRVGVDKLQQWVDEWPALWPNLSTDAQTEMVRGDFFRTAHDIKGQGTTFGFPLMTDLGNHICKRVKAGGPFTIADLESFKRDVMDMKRVLDENLVDDGGEAGVQIRTRLEEDI